MKKLCKFTFISIIVLGLNGCGEKEEDNYVKVSSTSFNYGKMPKKFTLIVENIKKDYFKFFLESPTKEIIISREVSKETTDILVCKEYSNEDTLVTYDCIITSSKDGIEPKKESIIIEKGLKYNFYTNDKEDNTGASHISGGEIFIPK